MKNIIILIILIISLTSCHFFSGNGIEFEIENNSKTAITDVEFTTSENLNSIKINKIEPGESVNDFLNMEDNQSDGGYILNFKTANGEIKQSGVGYYTNGGSLDGRIMFSIENDTVIARTSDY